MALKTIFSDTPGLVLRFDENMIPLEIGIGQLVNQGEGAVGVVGAIGEAVAGSDRIDSTSNLCLTQLGVSRKVRAQFSHSFGRTVYVYVFDQEVADLQLSGLVFPGQCRGNFLSGHEQLDRYWQRNNLASRGKAIEVRVGAKIYEGLLIAMRSDIADPATGIGAFSLLMKHLPE